MSLTRFLLLSMAVAGMVASAPALARHKGGSRMPNAEQLVGEKDEAEESQAPEEPNCIIHIYTTREDDVIKERVFELHLDSKHDCDHVARMHKNTVSKGVKKKEVTFDWKGR